MQQSLAERDERVLWHPFTPQKYASRPVGIVKGEGIYLIDEEDNRFIDAISSWWVTLHGHGHPYIAHKIYEQAKQLEQVIFAGFTHLPAVLLAEKLLPVLPGNFSRIFYSDNGSTATEVAIKMALQFWWNQGHRQRSRVIALHNGYHGDTFGAMSAGSRSLFTAAFTDKLFEVDFIDVNEPAGENMFSNIQLEKAACFIYEPLLQGAAGMKMHTADQLDFVLQWMKKHHIICIADEVMTGFGRTGTLFASDQCAIKPDIICLSKGLTGGTMALGITACTAAIHDAFVTDDPTHTFFHGHSFTANPIACSAAIASFELLADPACGESIQRIVQMHAGFIKTISNEAVAGKIKNLRQTGTILAFEVITDNDGYLNSISSVFTGRALTKGVFLRPLGNTVYVMPPYCITEEELGTIYSVIKELLLE
jgi:adenosylmethionine-8-amino-7-oxononanoate aminotransferase